MVLRYPIFNIILLLFLFNCSKDVAVDGYNLIYTDNEGNCVPCIQMRKISEDVIDERLADIKDSLNIKFKKVSVRSVEYEELRNKVKVSVKNLMLVKVVNGKEKKYSLINTNVIFFNLNKPEYCKDIIEKEIRDFIDEESK